MEIRNNENFSSKISMALHGDILSHIILKIISFKIRWLLEILKCWLLWNSSSYFICLTWITFSAISNCSFYVPHKENQIGNKGGIIPRNESQNFHSKIHYSISFHSKISIPKAIINNLKILYILASWRIQYRPDGRVIKHSLTPWRTEFKSG